MITHDNTCTPIYSCILRSPNTNYSPLCYSIILANEFEMRATPYRTYWLVHYIVHMHTNMYNSYLPVIGVHEVHGRMHPNYCQITIMLVVDLCSLLVYFMMIHPLPIAGKMPIKTLVAKELPTNTCTVT